MAQINVTLNENKSIKQYSNQAFEGSQLATINDADLASLGEYANLMWVDDNGLVHADNLPTTKYQQSLNQIKADIDNSQKQVNVDIQTIQNKIDAANQANGQLDNKLATINTAVDNANKLTANMQVTFAKELGTLTAKAAEVNK